MNKKLRDRGYFFSDCGHLEALIDQKILPKEHGGVMASEDMMEIYTNLAKERLPLLRAIDDISVDVEFVKKHSSDNNSGIGSFRKLEID